jgi:hypothetical protein
MRDEDVRIKMTPKRTIYYVMVPVEEYEQMVAELAVLRGLTSTAQAPATEYVRPLTNCDKGTRVCSVDGCESRAYATHAYCTKHRLRFERTGDPLLARKRGRKPLS